MLAESAVAVVPPPSLTGAQQQAIATVLSKPTQHTLRQRFTVSGIGLHSGNSVTVTVYPAPPNTGRRFIRTDIVPRVEVPAEVATVSQTLLSTELAMDGVGVRTVEHLLAALSGLGIDNARIELDRAEVPLLDGSAWEWVAAVLTSGWTAQDEPRSQWQLTAPCWVRQGDAFIAAFPAPELRLTYGIGFENPAIGEQWHSVPFTDFATEIAPARTFGLLADVEGLREKGLIQGGSLENALVCGLEGWLNPPLRYANEPVRHKLLDLVGDLSLLGGLPLAHIVAYKASHTLHTQLVTKLLQQGDRIC
jgi:UDP-3-O-[3-hydroxymyristoyl] N-acetylglucosamine deacetylase